MKITFRLNEKKDKDLIEIFKNLSPGLRSKKIKSLLRRGVGTGMIPVATIEQSTQLLKKDWQTQDDKDILKNLLDNF